jgi:hypothetical protein
MVAVREEKSLTWSNDDLRNTNHTLAKYVVCHGERSEWKQQMINAQCMPRKHLTLHTCITNRNICIHLCVAMALYNFTFLVNKEL